jgi:hypothetical protein
MSNDKKTNEPDATNQEHIVQEDSLELRDMSRKERRQYKWQQEKDKLAELTFWRRVQYIITYYGLKFIGIIAGIALIVLIIQRIYIANLPVALDIALVNDYNNNTFSSEVIDLYSSFYDVPENARYLIDNGYEIYPDSTYSSSDMAYYTKLYASITGDSTQIIICDADVVDYYAVDGYVLELKHLLPEDIYTYFEDCLYECDGPVEDSDFYAIDLAGTRFAELTELSQKHPMLMIPSSLSEENKEVAYNFLRMIIQLDSAS